MKDIWQLFIIFFRIGGFTFGGGYAMLPMIEQEIVNEKRWATKEEVIDYYAIGQCTPGIIAINTATLIGYKHSGILGSLAATLGMVVPSLLIIMTIATFFYQFQDYQLIQHAFGGIKIGVVALIAHIVVKMWYRSVKDYLGILLFILSFLLLAVARISPIIVIVSAALIGVINQVRRIKNLDKRNLDKELDQE
ncbi:chromate transporter [Natroniella sp. ANB-PHB2]|uniref:chromate transporter n=1 Tax=Natroniella sp. ANB-PHB2 TaxID=3384444 RepID=UPI0038D51674